MSESNLMRGLSFLRVTQSYRSFRYSHQARNSQFPAEPCDRMQYKRFDDPGRGCFDHCVPSCKFVGILRCVFAGPMQNDLTTALATTIVTEPNGETRWPKLCDCLGHCVSSCEFVDILRCVFAGPMQNVVTTSVTTTIVTEPNCETQWPGLFDCFDNCLPICEFVHVLCRYYLCISLLFGALVLVCFGLIQISHVHAVPDYSAL